MAADLTSTKKLTAMRVVGGKKSKRIGKVRHIVFHPTKRKVIGLTVKRPDAALMFHRKDIFVALDGFTIAEGQITVSDQPEAAGKEALKALGVDWDACVIWVGMPLVAESGTHLGYVDEVCFDRRTGAVESLTVGNGADDLILGKRIVPGTLVKGFRLSQGTASGNAEDGAGESEGAILVDEAAEAIPVQGGAAAAAGKATAVVAAKAKDGAAKAKAAAQERTKKAKPVVQDAAKKTGEAVDKGAFALGRQLGRTSGMFTAFKEEYRKAASDQSEQGRGD